MRQLLAAVVGYYGGSWLIVLELLAVQWDSLVPEFCHPTVGDFHMPYAETSSPFRKTLLLP